MIGNECKLALGYLIAEVEDRKSHKIIIHEEKDYIVELLEEAAKKCSDEELSKAHEMIKNE